MNPRFVDAVYLIALVNPKDQWHLRAVAFEAATSDQTLITTEDVLAEFLTFYAKSGEFMRRTVSEFVREILLDARIKVTVRKQTTFIEALELYESRLDKGYSLTDRISMNVCNEIGINEILTSDKHFAQEGFTVL